MHRWVPRLCLAMVGCLGAGAAAQSTLPPLEQVTAEIDRREVAVAGRVFGRRGEYMLDSGDSLYSVEFAVDRQTLERIRACEGSIFDAARMNCAVTGAGEIRVRGSQITLILFAIAFTD